MFFYMSLSSSTAVFILNANHQTCWFYLHAKGLEASRRRKNLPWSVQEPELFRDMYFFCPHDPSASRNYCLWRITSHFATNSLKSRVNSDLVRLQGTCVLRAFCFLLGHPSSRQLAAEVKQSKSNALTTVDPGITQELQR